MLYMVIAAQSEIGFSSRELVQNNLHLPEGKFKIYYRGLVNSDKPMSERMTILIIKDFQECSISYSGYHLEKKRNIKHSFYSVIDPKQLQDLCCHLLTNLSFRQISETINYILNKCIK